MSSKHENLYNKFGFEKVIYGWVLPNLLLIRKLIKSQTIIDLQKNYTPSVSGSNYTTYSWAI